jgi:hypothetical protein
MVVLGALLWLAPRPTLDYSHLPPTPTPTATERIAIALLQTAELPGWWDSTWRWEVDVPGAIARRGAFQRLGDGAQGWMKVSQTVAVYPTVAQSRTGYDERVQHSFPGPGGPWASTWFEPPGLAFANAADQLSAACMPVTINEAPLLTCCVVARYGDMVTEVWANVFPDDWLTMPQFRAVLERVNQRMRSVRQP